MGLQGVEGLDLALVDIDEKKRRLKDRTPAHQRAEELFEEAVRERFDTSTDFHGQAWAPDKPSTIKRKKGRGDVLEGDGTLRSRNYFIGRKHHIEVGNDAAHAARNYFGDRARDQPARPWFPVDMNGKIIIQPGTPGAELFDRISEAVARWIESGEV